MPRFATNAIDRAVAAVAGKIAARVGAILAPPLVAGLDKLRGDIRAEIAATTRQTDPNAAEQTATPHPVRPARTAAGAASDIAWFHSIDLGNGVVTAGRKSAALLEEEFARLHLTPARLAGRRVLDIGCNDGFFSLRCARLGGQVTAIDGVYSDGLKFVRHQLNPKFQFYCMDMMSPSFLELGHFDIILYLGILYHSMYPFEQLQRIASACAAGAVVLVETAYYNMPGAESEPTIFFDYQGKLSSDATSPVYPSIEWIKQTLYRLGFAQVSVLDPPSRLQAPCGRVTLCADYAERASARSPFLFAAEQL